MGDPRNAGSPGAEKKTARSSWTAFDANFTYLQRTPVGVALAHHRGASVRYLSPRTLTQQPVGQRVAAIVRVATIWTRQRHTRLQSAEWHYRFSFGSPGARGRTEIKEVESYFLQTLDHLMKIAVDKIRSPYLIELVKRMGFKLEPCWRSPSDWTYPRSGSWRRGPRTYPFISHRFRSDSQACLIPRTKVRTRSALEGWKGLMGASGGGEEGEFFEGDRAAGQAY